MAKYYTDDAKLALSLLDSLAPDATTKEEVIEALNQRIQEEEQYYYIYNKVTEILVDDHGCEEDEDLIADLTDYIILNFAGEPSKAGGEKPEATEEPKQPVRVIPDPPDHEIYYSFAQIPEGVVFCGWKSFDSGDPDIYYKDTFGLKILNGSNWASTNDHPVGTCFTFDGSVKLPRWTSFKTLDKAPINSLVRDSRGYMWRRWFDDEGKHHRAYGAYQDRRIIWNEIAFDAKIPDHWGPFKYEKPYEASKD